MEGGRWRAQGGGEVRPHSCPPLGEGQAAVVGVVVRESVPPPPQQQLSNRNRIHGHMLRSLPVASMLRSLPLLRFFSLSRSAPLHSPRECETGNSEWLIHEVDRHRNVKFSADRGCTAPDITLRRCRQLTSVKCTARKAYHPNFTAMGTRSTCSIGIVSHTPRFP